MKIAKELELQRVRLNKGRSAEYGIYYLLDEDSNVVFINYSKSGIRRIFDHLKGPEETKRKFTHYVWIGMPGEIECNLIELVRSEINLYKPVYNKPEICRGVITDIAGSNTYYTLAAYARLLDVKYHRIRDIVRSLRYSEFVDTQTGEITFRDLTSNWRKIRKYYHIDDLNTVVKPMLGINKPILISDDQAVKEKQRKKLLFKSNPIRIINTDNG